MKDDSEKKQRKRRQKPAEDESLAELLSSYTPEHRRAVLKGLRILARVAIRSYMEEKAEAEASPRPKAVQDCGEEVG